MPHDKNDSTPDPLTASAPEPSPWPDVEARTLADGTMECDVTTDGVTTRHTSTDDGGTWSDGGEVADPSAPDLTRAELLDDAVRCLTDGGFEELASRLLEALEGAGEQHPAIAVIDETVARALNAMKRPVGEHRWRLGELAELAAVVDHLTSARLNLVKGGGQ